MAKITGLQANVLANQFKKALDNKGYAFFERGDYNLNIVGVRNDSGKADTFDDFINVIYKLNGEWCVDTYPATTEPGTSILRRPINKKGTAILVPNQYRGVYKIDTHGGKRKYTALCQRNGEVEVWRDDKKNGQGINIWADGEKYVGEWRNDKRNGQGIFTFADGSIDEGIWENGNFLYAKEIERKPIPDQNSIVARDNIDRNKVISAASGSGFAVSSKGHVITNNHVIDGCQTVKIHHKGQAIPAIIVTYDPYNDIALLKGDFRPSAVFSLSNEEPELLQDIYVAGFPFGKTISSSVKVTKGIISSLSGIGNNYSNIQIDAAIQPGNSGGPIMDERGNVVGVAVAKLDIKNVLKDFGVIPENTNFGIKTNVVKSLLDSNNVNTPVPNKGKISKSKLGKMISSIKKNS